MAPKPADQKPTPNMDWRPLIFTLFVLFLYYYMAAGQQAAPSDVPYSTFKQKLDNDEIAAVQFKGQQLLARLRTSSDPKRFDFVTRRRQ